MEPSKNFLDKKDLVTIGFVTLITVFVWIGFQVYRTSSKDTVSQKTQELLTPLDTTLPEDVFNQLEATTP